MKHVNFFSAVVTAAMTAVLLMFIGCSKDEVAISSVEISSAAETVKIGSTVTLSYTYEPIDAKLKSAVWSSSSESVATVDQDGVVTGVAEGTATITITVNDIYTDTCEVTVESACPYMEILALNVNIGKSGQDVRTALTGNGWTEVGSSFDFNKTINGNNVRLEVILDVDTSICVEIVAYITDSKYVEYAEELVVAATDTYRFETLGKTAAFYSFTGVKSTGNDETTNYTEALNWMSTRTYTSINGTWLSTTSGDYNGLIIQNNPSNTLITVAMGNIY